MRALGWSHAVMIAGVFVAACGGLAYAASLPVFYGGEPDLDACTSQGEVTGLDPAGDNYLAVRAGPAVMYQMLDKLTPGSRVHTCDDNGNWIGIVYPVNGQDCGTGTSLAQRKPYKGPCKSGWVFGKYITIVSG
jgi:hypothetical protein